MGECGGVTARAWGCSGCCPVLPTAPCAARYPRMWGCGSLGCLGAAEAPARCLSPVFWPLCPAAKPGYCYHISEVEAVLDKECGSCHTGHSCSRCSSDADCHGVTKCCPSKCGYTCQEPVLGEGSGLGWRGSGVAAWRSQGWVTGGLLAHMG